MRDRPTGGGGSEGGMKEGRGIGLAGGLFSDSHSCCFLLFSILMRTPLFLLRLAVTRVESGGHVNVQLNILTKVRHSHKCGQCARSIQSGSE